MFIHTNHEEAIQSSAMMDHDQGGTTVAHMNHQAHGIPKLG